MLLTSVFQFNIDQEKKKIPRPFLWLIKKWWKFHMLSQLLITSQQHLATTASSFQPVYVHNENIFSSPVNNYCFPYGEVRGCPSLWSLKNPWLWSASWSPRVSACLSCGAEWGQTQRISGSCLLLFLQQMSRGGVRKKGAAVVGSCQELPMGREMTQGPPGGLQWLAALLAALKVLQKWVSAFDLEILAPFHSFLWCRGLFEERRRFYGLLSNLHDLPLEARGGDGGERTWTLSSCSPQPKVQELQVSQIMHSEKLKGNHLHSFLRSKIKGSFSSTASPCPNSSWFAGAVLWSDFMLRSLFGPKRGDMGNTFWFSISLLVTRLVLAVHPYVIQANGPEWVPVPVLERNEAKLSDNASLKATVKATAVSPLVH